MLPTAETANRLAPLAVLAVKLLRPSGGDFVFRQTGVFRKRLAAAVADAAVAPELVWLPVHPEAVAPFEEVGEFERRLRGEEAVRVEDGRRAGGTSELALRRPLRVDCDIALVGRAIFATPKAEAVHAEMPERRRDKKAARPPHAAIGEVAAKVDAPAEPAGGGEVDVARAGARRLEVVVEAADAHAIAAAARTRHMNRLDRL